MNLLDKASIILTPSAYNNGEALCVKPSDGSGDFDFSRNSAATRVNAQGLVEDVQILSSNLVQNGDFSDGSANWTLGSQWSIGTNKAIYDNSGNGNLSQNFTWQVGKKYKITFDIGDFTTSHRFDIYSGISFIKVSTTESNTSYTILFDGDGGSIFRFRGLIRESFSITNIKIIEITDDTNLPRISYENFSYDGSGNIVPDSGCGSWLFEPQSTNLIPYSEDFSQWTIGGDTTIESGYLAPDGTNNAYKVSGTSSALQLSASLLTTTTRSIYAKTTSGTGLAHLCSFNGNTNNLFTITEQWQRFDVNSAISTGSATFYAVDFRNQTNLSEIILWGANATNDQDYATSYIPSNGTTVTRNQDVCNNGGSVSTINSTEGVLYAEIAKNSSLNENQIAFTLSDGSTNNRVMLFFGANSTNINAQVRSNSASYFNASDALGANATNFNKIAIKYKDNDFSFWVNGVKIADSISGNAPIALNQLIFTRGDASQNFFGKTKCLAVWKEALTDLELQELTTI